MKVPKLEPNEETIDLLNAMDNARHAITCYLKRYRHAGYGMVEHNPDLAGVRDDLRFLLRQYDTTVLHQ